MSIKRNYLLRSSVLASREMSLQLFEEEDFRCGVVAGKKMAWDGDRRFRNLQPPDRSAFALGIGVGYALAWPWVVDLETM